MSQSGINNEIRDVAKVIDKNDGEKDLEEDKKHILPQDFVNLKELNLENLSISELSKIKSNFEAMVGKLNESLVTNLGLRDELEVEMEVKREFISLLLSINSKPRQQTLIKSPHRRNEGRNMIYLPSVIPYNAMKGCPSITDLEVLVKILRSIKEDSPEAASLLRDFILQDSQMFLN